MEQVMETWKSIAGFEGLYQVSNLGNVRSFDRETRIGSRMIKKPGKMLSQTMRNGYKFVTLCKDATRTHVDVHRLVAQAFIDNPNSLPEVNHKNGIKTDPIATNLEWCTHDENMKHASRTGLLKRKAA